MPKNPITDVWQFLTGMTGDHLELGVLGKILAVLYVALLAGSIVIAIVNWRQDAAQRTGTHLGTWAVRVLIGSMWFEGMLWKLPLPVGGGLQFWTEQMATRAAFEFHREFVKNVLLPHMAFFGPLVFLAELFFAVAFLLGIGTRLAALIGIAFVLQLWLGIYLPAQPAEWPWSYIFLAMVMFFMLMHAAGRSLGLDGYLRRNVPAVRDGQGLIGRLLRIAG